jgi:hypothetical protein
MCRCDILGMFIPEQTQSATFVHVIMSCMKTTGFNPGLYVHSVQPGALLLRKLRFYWVSETCESVNHTNFQALL